MQAMINITDFWTLPQAEQAMRDHIEGPNASAHAGRTWWVREWQGMTVLLIDTTRTPRWVAPGRKGSSRGPVMQSVQDCLGYRWEAGECLRFDLTKCEVLALVTSDTSLGVWGTNPNHREEEARRAAVNAAWYASH